MADPLDNRSLHSERLDPDHALPERGTPGAIGHVPEQPEAHPRLNQAAETVGRALGTAVSGVRNIPDKLNEGKQRFEVIRGGGSERAKAKVNEAVEHAREKGEELVGKAKEKGEELLEQAREKGEELKEQAQIRLEQARARAARIARTDPLRVIGAAAVFGIVLGIVLRLWRDHHAG
jgi:ElaB/YqjD/DUF883 family membrane-anchored ribosome-binding protein